MNDLPRKVSYTAVIEPNLFDIFLRVTLAEEMNLTRSAAVRAAIMAILHEHAANDHLEIPEHYKKECARHHFNILGNIRK